MNNYEIEEVQKIDEESEEIESGLPSFIFNEGQQAAIDGLGEGLGVGNTVCGLVGGAGRGKTTVFQEVLRQFIRGSESTPNIAVVAPTNKAVRVARQMGEKAKLSQNIEYKTLHSLLGLQVDEEEGKKKLKKSERELNISDYDLIVIDEASMVNQEITNQLLSKTEGEVPLLIVGDRFQLPPVGENYSPMFGTINENYSFELTENMRQGEDSPCAELVEECMNAVIQGKYRFDPRQNNNLIKKQGNSKGTWLMNNDDWNKYLIPAFKAAQRIGEWDHVRMLAFFHNTIENINEYIRESLFGEISKTTAFIEGEPLVCLSPITRRIWDDRKQKIVKTILLPTATETKVYSARESIDSINVGGENYTYPIWNICAQILGSDNTIWLKIPSPEIKKRWKEDCDKLKLKAIEAKKNGNNNQWKYYYQLLEFFDDVRVAYGLTIYSCQGSTYRNVFIPGGDIEAVKNFDVRNRSWYVATSRASDKIILC
jgi:AAA domain/UvrD-like helicase C-terminal domain